MFAFINGLKFEWNPKEILEIVKGLWVEDIIPEPPKERKPIVWVQTTLIELPVVERKKRTSDRYGRKSTWFHEPEALTRRHGKQVSAYRVYSDGREEFQCMCISQREAGEVANISETSVSWSIKNNEKTRNPEGESWISKRD